MAFPIAETMLLIDANLLIYAYHAESAEHAAAKVRLEDVMSGSETVALPWLSVLAFLRITTHQRIFERPLSMDQARDFVASWLQRLLVHAVEAGADFFAIFFALLASAQIKGALVTEAALAALAIEHGATLCSTDSDFARFPGLRWTNPFKQV